MKKRYNFFSRVADIIKKKLAQRNSRTFIRYIRKKNVRIGTNCIFRDPKTAFIDLTRPELISIGNNVDMNRNFTIMSHDYGSLVFLSKYKDFINSSGKVVIGNNIYFGTNVIILKGVTIGDNCIIGAGSVVTRSIPSNSVAAGNPCRVLSSIDDYYHKRKDRALKEAVEWVNAFFCRYGRHPQPKELREEFIYFTNKYNTSSYESVGVQIKEQLADVYSDWMDNHLKSKFENFEEFIKFCKKESEK